MMLSSISIFLFLKRRSNISLAYRPSRTCVSFSASLILAFALELFTMFSHSRLGVWLLEVSISTVSPLCSCCLNDVFLPFTLPPTHVLPIFECMW